jgi:hypothetical protein
MFTIIATPKPTDHHLLATSLTETEARIQAQAISYEQHAEYQSVGVYNAQGECIHLFSAGTPCL